MVVELPLLKSAHLPVYQMQLALGPAPTLTACLQRGPQLVHYVGGLWCVS